MALGLPMAIMYGSAIAGGAGILGGLLGKGKSQDPGWSQAPEYPEATESRKLWWDKLQSWGSDPYYGAISPDWSNIWQQASDKVRAYYAGTPTGQGAYGQLKGSFAARNVVGSPAMARSLARLQAEEAGQLRDIATQQAISKADFGESARKDWLGNLSNLASQRPTSQFISGYQAPSTSQVIGNALSSFGGLAGSGLMAYGSSNQQQKESLAQQKMLFDFLGRQNTSYGGYRGNAGYTKY